MDHDIKASHNSMLWSVIPWTYNEWTLFNASPPLK